MQSSQSCSNGFDSSKSETKQKTNSESKTNVKPIVKLEQNLSKEKRRQINGMNGMNKLENIKFNEYKENDPNEEENNNYNNEDKPSNPFLKNFQLRKTNSIYW